MEAMFPRAKAELGVEEETADGYEVDTQFNLKTMAKLHPVLKAIVFSRNVMCTVFPSVQMCFIGQEVLELCCLSRALDLHGVMANCAHK